MNLTYEQKYQLLFGLFQKIRDTLDLDEIMAHLLDTIDTILPYDAAGIFVLNRAMAYGRGAPPKNMIAGMCVRGFDLQPANDDMLMHGKGIIGHVIFSGTSLIAPDVRRNQHYIAGRPETLSEIAVPILQNECTIGALNLESDRLAAYDTADLEVLQFFADAAAIALEKALLHRQLLEKELLDKQLSLARDVQMHLLPQAAPRVPGYDIAGVCIPTEEIGGDYYDFLPLPHGKLGLVVADVSGHGIAAALAMSAFRVLLRTHAQGKLSLEKIARAINQELPESTGGRHFITMVYGVLDPGKDALTLVSCGHPSPCLLHQDSTCDFVSINGPAFGIYQNVSYQPAQVALSQDDILLMYTDGVVEIENQAGEAFGMARLAKLVRDNRDLNAADLIQRVIDATRAFSGSELYLDDFTLVIAKRE